METRYAAFFALRFQRSARQPHDLAKHAGYAAQSAQHDYYGPECASLRLSDGGGNRYPKVASYHNDTLMRQSTICSFISSELALSSGAYIASAFVGNALNLPGISARRR